MATIATRAAFPHRTGHRLGIHDGHDAPDPLLDDLGPHSTGKGCLYLERLADADPAVLEQLVRNAWQAADSS